MDDSQKMIDILTEAWRNTRNQYHLTQEELIDTICKLFQSAGLDGLKQNMTLTGRLQKEKEHEYESN